MVHPVGLDLWVTTEAPTRWVGRRPMRVRDGRRDPPLPGGPTSTLVGASRSFIPRKSHAKNKVIAKHEGRARGSQVENDKSRSVT